MITKCGESGKIGNWSESESTLGLLVNIAYVLSGTGTRLALADFSNSLWYL